ncbi:GNAT family N-acetyltransferase [Acrocarpospora sp. B8E8]|uniref:GNAT family N-acetyltransferase n=1 Tax=Acrocarpospora sp. B8E8 TaxID=3153572 RepID=UPI00325FA3D8
MTIVYETHSITTDNEAGVASGWSPGELSSRGRELALELGERRRGDGLAAVFSSDLWRAVQTAEIAFAGSAIPIQIDTRLRECDYGDGNGMPVARLAAERAAHIDVPWPGGQSYRQVVEQTRDFLRDLVTMWDGARILVIAHSANRWALDHLLTGAALEDLVDAPFAWQPGWTYTLHMDTRVILVPLTVGDADDMVEVLAGQDLYAFIGGTPPTLTELRNRYAKLAAGRSPDGRQEWLNWIIRRRNDNQAIGTVQATVADGGAEIAWVVGLPWQGHGYAREAARLLVEELATRGVRHLRAHIHPDHHASMAVASHVGLAPTDHFHDGERRWERIDGAPGFIQRVV